MKKFLLLTFIFCAVISTATNAQPQPQPQPPAQAPDPAAMLQQMKEKIRPEMVAKTGLTVAQCDKVIELNFEMRMAAAALKDLPEAERTSKIQELKAAKEKKFTEFLTPEQIKAVKDFYENVGKKTP